MNSNLSGLLSSQITCRCCKGMTKITFPNGDVYNGEWKDGKANGQGVMWKYASGDVYSGEWQDGKQSGLGLLEYAGGDVYWGEWQDGKQSGLCIYEYSSGEAYVGEWKDGKWKDEDGQPVYKD